MCGLIASFTALPIPITAVQGALLQMLRRGPDGDGIWQEGAVCLGHRRLAIVDLDRRASQPMHSSCGRYVIAFNGEIYNFKALRRELSSRGVVFNTISDTEVILALFAAEGEAMLPKLHGMFAFVIWDRLARRAFAARDPYGIKPLYIATAAGGVIVASQVKALLATGLVSREPNARAQAGFWMLGSVPEPHTWFRDVSCLPAGHYVWIQQGNTSTPHCWLDVGALWRSATIETASATEVRERVNTALVESVARHLVADVPIGVFLSGGIDSGALAGLMVQLGARNLEGVTIAYDEFVGRHEDEAPVASTIALHYGIRHTVRIVTRQEFLEDVPRILAAMDQPSIDGINTWYASKAVAERGLKVVVSGLGGDEMFQGYPSFRQLPRLVSHWAKLSRIPGAISLAQVGALLQWKWSGNRRWQHAPHWARSIGGAWWLRRSVCAPEELPELMGPLLAAEVVNDFSADEWVETMAGPSASDPVMALCQIESTSYLRNQLLRDSDWASMDHSVELRTPLVDAHLLEQLQPQLRALSSFPNKMLLAEAPTNPLPRSVIERRKTGFGIPLKSWLTKPTGTSSANTQRGWMRELVKAYECA